MNTGCGERGRNGREGRRKGPPCWSAVTGVIQRKKHSCAQMEQACSQAHQPGPALSSRGPFQDPSGGFQGYSCRTIHSGPTPPTPPPASPPLLGSGSKKVLGWADSGGNSIEFSFGYILKAKVSWTYSQNG